MKKTILIFFALTFCALSTIEAQKFFTRDGKVSFESDAPLEKIEAKNSNATSVLDTESGKLEFAVLVKAFQFEKALMQEHFNENYMDSDKFPKAVFKGKIEGFDFEKLNSKEKEFKIAGTMTIKGKSKAVETIAKIKFVNNHIFAVSEFVVQPEDFGIKIPSIVRNKVAKDVKISFEYELVKKS